jgi:hypothetical protein
MVMGGGGVNGVEANTFVPMPVLASPGLDLTTHPPGTVPLIRSDDNSKLGKDQKI